MRFEIDDATEAERAIEYFNAFHDGFVKGLCLTSHDSFPERGVQAANGPPDLEIVLAHYNYERDTRPPNQLVRASFRGVMELTAEISGLATDTPIKYVTIQTSSRRREDGSEETCLQASVFASHLDQSRAWSEVEAIGFTFEHAEFEEL